MSAHLELVPIGLRAARAFIGQEHRHNRKVAGGKFALAARYRGQLVGVVIVGRTTARGAHAETTAEITRLATDGHRNACSFLIRRARRACQAMGYTRVITYTRRDESGASLRAAGCVAEKDVKGRQWTCASRPRVVRPVVDKVRWRVA